MRRLITTMAAVALLGAAPAPIPGSDIPPKFKASEPARDFVMRDVMIPMRDGVKLHSIILIPNGVGTGAARAPIILDRTPYGAKDGVKGGKGLLLEGLVSPSEAELAAAGYILVVQDIRGRFGSGGDYRLLRPLAGPLNPTKVDHSTDAWDSIDWLVKNVPESNGRVATMGTSYDGFTTLMSLVGPHPALKAAVPFNPVADVWTGDDLFHHGAFRQTYLDWVHSLVSEKSSEISWFEPRHDGYDTWMAGSAGAVASAAGLDQSPFWQRVVEHPAYDDYWQGQAVDRILARQPLAVPTLMIHSQWDQEDIYGAPAVYAAMEPKDTANDRNFLVIGPWRHGGGNGDGSALGPIKFGGDTGKWFRTNVLIPFLDARLKDGAATADIAPVTAFETGSNVWRRYDRWPQACAAGCPQASQPLYLRAGGKLGSAPPAAGEAEASDYIADPAHPVTYRPRPIRPTYADDSTWGRWLVDDQRFASDRPDVLTFVGPVLTAPLRLAGAPVAHLVAATTGSDVDWVVKLIDVYPDNVARQAELGGYQLPVAMDIMRGRYHDDPARPSPVPAGEAVRYTLQLPNVAHVFQPGHRVMVQIQSSWFPLYDRNPQTYVPNIFKAKPGDYQKATQRIFHAPDSASYIELPVVK